MKSAIGVTLSLVAASMIRVAKFQLKGGNVVPDRHLALLALGLAFSLSLLVAGMDHTPSADVMIALVVASALSSIADFAFSAICGAILFHISTNQVQIVETMIVCSVANQAAMVWSMRCDVDWPRLVPFLAGGVAGLPLGVWILLNVQRAT